MSNYYKYNFVSPEQIYATIKEEFKSYFDTGAVDDLMFPTYLDKCLRKLGKATYTITETTLFIEDFEARLPDNFYAVREAWMCAEIPMRDYQSPNSFYSQTDSSTTIQISPVTIGGESCSNPSCTPQGCDECMPEVIQAVYKTNQSIARSFKQVYLLKPGNISAKDNCDVSYSSSLEHYGQHTVNPFASSIDSFDIRDNKFVTNFRNGVVHLIFYATAYDDYGNQFVPDNYRVMEYIEAFIKFKLMEAMTNQTMDETFNQLQQKLEYYKQASNEAYVMAELEIKKQDVYTKVNRIIQNKNRFNKYEIRVRGSRFGRRNR